MRLLLKTGATTVMAGFVLSAAVTMGGCSPTVRLEAPKEPIRFDVNVNITEEKRLQIDQELLSLIRRNPALFGFEEGELPDAFNESEVE